MNGMVSGGWGFVVAAYTVTALWLGGYTLSVLLRYRSWRRQVEAGEAGHE